MKKRMKSIFMTIFLLLVFTPCFALAKDSGEVGIEVSGDAADIYLKLPESRTETITSLRFRVYADLKAGELSGDPVFEFSDELTSYMQSAQITLDEEDNEYCVDIILSGGREQTILSAEYGEDSPGTRIGTLRFKPIQRPFCAEVSLRSEDDDEETVPYVEYMDAAGTAVLRAHVTNTEPKTVGEEARDIGWCEIMLTPETFTYDGTPKTPEVTIRDEGNTLTENTDYTVLCVNNEAAGFGTVVITGIGNYTSECFRYFTIEQAEHPENMPQSTMEAVQGAATLADVALPDGWSWEDAAVALVRGGSVTGKAVYTANDRSNYKVCEVFIAVSLADAAASQPAEPQPPAPETETPRDPSVPVLTAKPQTGTKKIKLSWEKVSQADGYQIYLLDAKTGKYKHEKTITNGRTTSYTAAYGFGKTLTFKMRSYRFDSKGRKISSKFCSPVKVKIPRFDKTSSVKATGTAKHRSAKVTFRWNRITGADGYQIFQKNAKGKYQRLKTVTSGSTVSYTTAALKYAKNYSFKVRAYALDSDGKTKVYTKLSPEIKVRTSPAQVKELAVTARGKQRVRVTWARTSGASGYRVYRSTSEKGTYKVIKEITDGSTLRYVDRDLDKGATYYYKVRAFVKGTNGKYVFGNMSEALHTSVR